MYKYVTLKYFSFLPNLAYPSYPSVPKLQSLNEIMTLTYIQYSIEIQILVATFTIDSSDMVIDSKGMPPRRGSPDADSVPFAIAQSRLCSVSDPDWPITQVKHIVNMTLHQLHSYEIAFSSSIEQDQTIRLTSLELQT